MAGSNRRHRAKLKKRFKKSTGYCIMKSVDFLMDKIRGCSNEKNTSEKMGELEICLDFDFVFGRADDSFVSRGEGKPYGKGGIFPNERVS